LKGDILDSIQEELAFSNIIKVIKDKMKDFPSDPKLAEIPPIEQKFILELMRKPKILQVSDGNELYYVNDDGDKVYIDPRTGNSETLDEFIKDVFLKLPPVPFDLYCGGVKRKQQEVASAYTITVVNTFLNDIYSSDIKDVRESYDYDNFKSLKEKGRTFADIFKMIQEDSTPIVKFLITCCFTNIAESKEKNEALFIGIVSQRDQEALEQVITTVKGIEYKYSKIIEGKKSKLERLQQIKEKDEEILSLYSKKGKRMEILYKVHKLNSSSLNPNDAPIIKQASRNEAKVLLEKGTIEDEDFFKKFIAKQSQKAMRMRVRQMKIDRFREFSEVSDGNYLNILPKN
jgi:hypothetical protein